MPSADARTPASQPKRRAMLLGGLSVAAIAGLPQRADALPAGDGAAPGAFGVNVRSRAPHRATAVGDGTTDDTAAIQSAIDETLAAGGGTVIFPAGTYAVSSPLRIAVDADTEVNLRLAGEGPASKIQRLDPTAGHGLLEISGPLGRGGNLKNIGLADLYFGSASGVQTDTPTIKLTKTIQFTFDRCHIEQPGATALAFEDAYIGNVIGCVLRNNDDAITLTGVSNAIRFIGNRIQANTGVGITLPSGHYMSPNGYIPQAMALYIAGNDIEGNGAEAILLSNGVYRGVSIVGNYFELNFNPAMSPQGGPSIHKIRTTPPLETGTPKPYADCRGITITGNFFYHKNRDTTVDDLDYSVIFEDGTDIVVTGNGWLFINGTGAARYETSRYRFGPAVKSWVADPDDSTALAYKGAIQPDSADDSLVVRSAAGNAFRLVVDDDGTVHTVRA